MKTIGLIGGMSWESTAEYYRLFYEGVRSRLGKLHSALHANAAIEMALL
jgi:aspartate racemase